MGIWAILEEESLFPKATDKSFEEKLKASLGKLPIFLKPQSKTDKVTNLLVFQCLKNLTLTECPLCYFSLCWHCIVQCDQLAGEKQGSCQWYRCWSLQIHEFCPSSGLALGRSSWSAHYCSQGGGKEEEEGRWWQDCFLCLLGLSWRTDEHSSQLRASLCPLPCAQHSQEARRGWASTDHAPAHL